MSIVEDFGLVEDNDLMDIKILWTADDDVRIIRVGSSVVWKSVT